MKKDVKQQSMNKLEKQISGWEDWEVYQGVGQASIK